MDDIPKIGITGMPGVGKTDTLIKVVKHLEESGYSVGGMITEALNENNKRLGFNVVDWKNKKTKVFAHLDIDTGYRIGKYGVDIKALEEIGVPAVEDAINDDKTDIIIIDEI